MSSLINHRTSPLVKLTTGCINRHSDVPFKKYFLSQQCTVGPLKP